DPWVRSSLVGALYVMGVTLWSELASSWDARGLSQAREVEALVHGRYQREILHVGVAMVATAIVLGVLLGTAAALLQGGRERGGGAASGGGCEHREQGCGCGGRRRAGRGGDARARRGDALRADAPGHGARPAALRRGLVRARRLDAHRRGARDRRASPGRRRAA